MQMYCTAEMLNRITTYRRKSLDGVQLLLLHTLMRVGMSSFIKTNKQKKKEWKKRKSKSLGHKGENPPAPTARTSVVLGIIKLITQHTVAAVVS